MRLRLKRWETCKKEVGSILEKRAEEHFPGVLSLKGGYFACECVLSVTGEGSVPEKGKS